MKVVAAVILVVVSIAAAEQPSGPYPPRGWQPSGPAFRLPERSQQAQAPPTLYGPPSQEYGPATQNEPTTTEVPTTTEAVTEEMTQKLQAETFPAKNQKLQSAAAQTSPAAPPTQLYYVLPQAQNLLYAAPLRLANPSYVPVRAPEKLVQETSAAPASAKIQAPEAPVFVEQYPQVVRYQQLQVVPSAQAYASALSQSSVFTPYSSSFVQIYQ